MSELKAETRLAKIVHMIDSGYAGALEVAINWGSHQGVKIGDGFLIFSTGPHIVDPDTGEDLGALELVRGRGKVVHVQEHLATVRSTERRRARPAKRITRQPGWSAAGLGPVITEEELSPEEDVPFDSVQLGDLAKPI